MPDLYALLEDVIGTRQTRLLLINDLFTEDDNLFEQENPPFAKIKFVRLGWTAVVSNQKTVLQQQLALCHYLTL